MLRNTDIDSIQVRQAESMKADIMYNVANVTAYEATDAAQLIQAATQAWQLAYNNSIMDDDTRKTYELLSNVTSALSFGAFNTAQRAAIELEAFADYLYEGN